MKKIPLKNEWMKKDAHITSHHITNETSEIIFQKSSFVECEREREAFGKQISKNDMPGINGRQKL